MITFDPIMDSQGLFMHKKPLNTNKKTGSTPVYYWDIIFGDEALLETYKDTINKVKNGNLKSADFDLKVHPTLKIYSIKSNRADRLFFTEGIVDGKRALILMEVLKFHNLRKAKSFQVGFVQRSKRKAEATRIEDELIFIDPDDEEANALQLLIEGINDDTPKPVVQYIDNFLVLNDVQNESLKMRTPLLLNGGPGGGKSLVGKECLLRYSNAFKDKRFLYLTSEAPLAESMKKILATDGIDEDRVKCSTYQQEILDNTDCKRLIEAVERLDWLNKYIKILTNLESSRASSSKGATLPSLPKNADILLKEFYIISGCSTFAEYESIGQKNSQFSKEEKSLIWSCYVSYQSYLKKEGYTDVLFSSLKWNTKYYGVFSDESQDLIPNQLNQVLSLADNKNIIFSSDTTQTTTDQKSVDSFLLKLVDNNQISLDVNHRNPPMVQAFDNIILSLGYNLAGGARDKRVPLPKRLQKDLSQMPVSVFWISEADALTLDSVGEKSVDLVVVTLPQFLNEAKAKYKSQLVVTIAQIKGHQAKYILMYKVFDALNFGTILNDDAKEHAINLTIDDETTHLSKRKELPQYYYNYIANLHVAISRALEYLYVYEDAKSIHRIKYLLDLINSQIKLLENTKPYIPEQVVSDEAEWEKTKTKLAIVNPSDKETTNPVSDSTKNTKNTKNKKNKATKVVNNPHLEISYIDTLCNLIEAKTDSIEAESLLKKLDNDKQRQQVINKPSTNSMTPFMIAAKQSNYKLIEYMLSCFPDQNDTIVLLATQDSDKKDALYHAACNRNYELFDKLLSCVNSIDDKVRLLNKIRDDGDSLLMYSVRNNCIEIFKRITPHFTKKQVSEHFFYDAELMQLIEFTNPTTQWNAPLLAIEMKNSEFLTSMLNILSEKNRDILIRKKDSKGNNLLSMSVLKNSGSLVSTLLSNSTPASIVDLIKSSSIDKCNIMGYIVSHSYDEILELIISKLESDQKSLLDALMHTNKNDGISCLRAAVIANNISAVKKILNALKDPNDQKTLVLQKDAKGLNNYNACDKDDIRTLLKPYSETNTLFRLQTRNFKEYILEDCANIKQAFEKIQDKNQRFKKVTEVDDIYGMTWLMHAAGRGDVDLINYLFSFYPGKKGAYTKKLYISMLDKNGMNALDIAIRHNQPLAMNAILENLPEKEDKLSLICRSINCDFSALMHAVWVGNLNIIKYTLDYCKDKNIYTGSLFIRTPKSHGCTILEHATSAQQMDVVTYLVDYLLHSDNKNSIFPELINGMSDSQLIGFNNSLEPSLRIKIIKAIFGNVMIIRRLVLANCKIELAYLLNILPDDGTRKELLLLKNAKDKGMGPLITAVQKNNLEMVEIILKSLLKEKNKKSVVNNQCDTGDNAYRIAVALGYDKIVAALKPYYNDVEKSVIQNITEFGLFKDRNLAVLSEEEIRTYLNKIVLKLTSWEFISINSVSHRVNDEKQAGNYLDILNKDKIGTFTLVVHTNQDAPKYCYCEIVCNKLNIKQILYQFYQHDKTVFSNNQNVSYIEEVINNSMISNI